MAGSRLTGCVKSEASKQKMPQVGHFLFLTLGRVELREINELTNNSTFPATAWPTLELLSQPPLLSPGFLQPLSALYPKQH